MSKINSYAVDGRFHDDAYCDKDDKQIKYADSNYFMTIEAEDMKKAHDLAMEYMPAGSVVTCIRLNMNPRGYRGNPEPF